MIAKVGNSRVVIRVAGLLLGVALPAGDALAQTAKDLVGTWRVASVTSEQGGTELEPFEQADQIRIDGDAHGWVSGGTAAKR